MWRFLRALFSFMAGYSRDAHANPDSGQIRDAPAGRGAQGTGSGGFVDRTEHVDAGPVQPDGTMYVEEKVMSAPPGAPTTRVLRREMRTCGCGHLLAYGNDATGTCVVCSNTVCKLCASTCSHCGACVCLRHSYSIGGKTYCPAHRLIGATKLFLGYET